MRYMVHRSPFRGGMHGYSDFDALFNGVFGGSASMTSRSPRVDVREEQERYVLEADMPGLSQDEIEVKVENNVLTFSSIDPESRREDSARNEAAEEQRDESAEGRSTSRSEKSDGRGQYLLKERIRPSYSRSFSLPKDADPAQIEAHYSGGVLTLTIKKAEEAKPRNIKINAA